MRQNSTLLLFLCSFLGFSQLYVSEGTLFSLETPQTLLSSKEVINQVDAPLYGQGVLFLNHSAAQQLHSTQTLLSLPNLQLANAALVRIETAVYIHNQLRIDAGVLVLDQDIHLPSKALLVLGATASTESQSGQLRFHTQLDTDKSLVWHTTPTVLKYTKSEAAPTPSIKVPSLSQASNFGYTAHGYTAYFENATPPPKQA
jgi:hypothetical protein